VLLHLGRLLLVTFRTCFSHISARLQAIHELLRLHAISPQLNHPLKVLEGEVLCLHFIESGSFELVVGAFAKHIDVASCIQGIPELSVGTELSLEEEPPLVSYQKRPQHVALGLSDGASLPGLLVEQKVPQLPAEGVARNKRGQFDVTIFQFPSDITHLYKQCPELIPIDLSLIVVICCHEIFFTLSVIQLVTQILHSEEPLVFIKKTSSILIKSFKGIQRSNFTSRLETSRIPFRRITCKHGRLEIINIDLLTLTRIAHLEVPERFRITDFDVQIW
jgi:hypothetical protein